MHLHTNGPPLPLSVPQESLCSLRFAAKVNQCETAAKGGAQRNVSTMEWGSGVAALVRRLGGGWAAGAEAAVGWDAGPALLWCSCEGNAGRSSLPSRITVWIEDPPVPWLPNCRRGGRPWHPPMRKLGA